MKDRAYSAMADAMRRDILGRLREEDDLDVADCFDDEHGRIALRHNHLPRLDALGYISWNRGSGEIDRGENYGEVRPLVVHLLESVDGRATGKS